MPKLPQHIQEYVETSPYGPFTEVEIIRLAERLANGAVAAVEEYVELDLLALRAACEQTPRNIAIFNNAISLRSAAKGLQHGGPICPCGSHTTLFDVDGPDPLQKVCSQCGAPVSDGHIDAVESALQQQQALH